LRVPQRNGRRMRFCRRGDCNLQTQRTP
jgi:hypothetical protein